jgi:hypothetical protein
MIAQPIFENQTSSSQSWVSTPYRTSQVSRTPQQDPSRAHPTVPSASQPRSLSSPLYHQSIIQLLNNYGLVSPDAAIAIVFGLVGAIISFAGVVIACLTLRFMMSALPSLYCQHESTFYSSAHSGAYINRVLKQMSEVSEYMVIVRFFVMSICISSHYLRVKD